MLPYINSSIMLGNYLQQTTAAVDIPKLSIYVRVQQNYDFLFTVKEAPHECEVKAENEAWFYSKVTVSSCAITSV